MVLWDPESTQFQFYLRPFPRYWRTLIHFNVVLTDFHIDHISQGVWKTVRTTCWCIIVLHLGAEGQEKAHYYRTDSGQIFRTFSPQLENNNTLKCSSDSFAHTLRYVVNTENCQNYIVSVLPSWKLSGVVILANKARGPRAEGPKARGCISHYPFFKSDVLEFNSSSTSYFNKCIF